MKSHLSSIGLAVTAFLAAYSLPYSSAQALPPFNRPFEIRLWQNQNFCVDVQGSNIRNGTRIQLWGCNKTSAQFWKVGEQNPNSCGSAGCSYRIALRDYPNYCLDYFASSERPPRPGDILYLWQCNQAAYWFDVSGSQSGSRILVGMTAYPSNQGYDTRVMDLSNNQVQYGRTIQMWDPNNTTAQFWFFNPI
jgi:hypothetical protein